MSDLSNRRKELKFAATDLKLYRRQQETSIDHWGVWRERSTNDLLPVGGTPAPGRDASRSW